MKRTREILSLKQVEDATDEKVFKAVCLDVAEDLEADLVSIWFFDSNQTRIECQCSYDAVTGEFSKSHALKRNDFPSYFKTVVEETFISAPDACTHHATKELTEIYFKPNGIQSLLDFIIHKDFKPIGVVCCENRSTRREWSEENKNTLRMIAALVSHRFRFS